MSLPAATYIGQTHTLGAKTWEVSSVNPPIWDLQSNPSNYAIDALASRQAAAASATVAQQAALEAQLAVPPVQVADYAGIDAYNGVGTTLYVTSYLVTPTPSGIAGWFKRNDTDTTTAPDHGTRRRDALGRLWERVSDGAIFLSWFKGVSDTAALQEAAEAAGPTGSVVITGRSYGIEGSGVVSCGRLIFGEGGVLAPTPGSEFIIDAEIVAGNLQCFDVGKIVTACDCNAGSTALRTWTYGFEASDVGKAVCLRYGGAVTGPAPGAYCVQNRLPFNTTITGYTSDSQVTLAVGPTSAIRQDYVIDAGYANINAGIAIVGNGTVEFTEKVGEINVKWFGSAAEFAGDAGVSLNKAAQSVSRRYGGAQFILPDGMYIQGRDLRVDVGGCTLKSNPRKATLYRKNGVALERMNNITAVWRGRYGGGGPTKAAEHWTFTGLSGSTTVPYWGGDWAIMSGLTLDGPLVNGNKANQPALTPGTGLDSWDAGLSTMYTMDALVKNTSGFVNMLRWGNAFSTQSHRATVEDGTLFDSCDEGAVYAETSDDVCVGSIVAKNSPAAGWNMGAVTFLRIHGGVIKAPMTTGCHNGIYVRDDCRDIDVGVGKQKNCTGVAVWLFDESLGSAPLKNITISGGSVDGSVNGLDAKFVNGLSVIGLKGDVTDTAVRISHCTEFIVCANSAKGAVADIVIDSGTAKGTVSDNMADVTLVGTSTTHLTVNVPSGYSFTNTATGYAYISVTERSNFGDGVSRFKVNGGISIPSSAYSRYPLDIGGSTIWRDSLGKWRTLDGYPTAESDGTVIGTQS